MEVKSCMPPSEVLRLIRFVRYAEDLQLIAPRSETAAQRGVVCGWTKSISHHLTNPGMMVPLYIPTTNSFPVESSNTNQNA